MIERPCMGQCGRYVVPPASRCDECLNAQRRRRRNPGYDDPRYRARRRNVKRKTCQRCHKRAAETVHHIDGNPRNNTAANLQDLCTRCAREADKEMRDRRRRRV